MTDREHRLTGWQLDRSAPEAYEQYLVPAIFASWTERLLDRVDLRDGERVLDVACGTGIVARSARHRVGEAGSVVGVDINQGMLAVAERAAAEASREIEWREADASELPFDAAAFDVVCCQQALQFFEDPVAALEEMRRVLSPGGKGALSVWRPIDHQPGYVVHAEALARHVGDEANTMMRSPFPEWAVDDLHTTAEAAGCTDATVTIDIGSMRYPSASEFVRQEAASSPLAAQIAEIDAATRNELVADVSAGLDRYTDDRGITTPMESYVLRWDE